ncbi:MAG: hypothetical protein COT85_06055 [Chlamydiae bacterium CG10_big_fil_rev_8_21_14_0_10_42_34]|nr:MAG: hypothetical protein COT85_06055 [Chlamydiae bacterium CG10_big_fil_rev_8_21_14_0_10_42_34]
MAKITALILSICTLFANETSYRKIDDSTWALFRPNAPLGLTIKSRPLSPKTLNQLAHIGIRYTFNTTVRPATDPNRSSLDRGLLFLSDFENREDLFRKWFEQFTYHPSKITITESVNPSTILIQNAHGN